MRSSNSAIVPTKLCKQLLILDLISDILVREDDSIS